MDDIRDRGMIKWNSSFMMPEHVEMLKDFQNDYHKEEKPILDEYQLQEIDEKINAAVEFHLPIIIEIWNDGLFDDVEGVINKVDNINKIVWITERNGDLHKIKYEDIVNVDFAE